MRMHDTGLGPLAIDAAFKQTMRQLEGDLLLLAGAVRARVHSAKLGRRAAFEIATIERIAFLARHVVATHVAPLKM